MNNPETSQDLVRVWRQLRAVARRLGLTACDRVRLVLAARDVTTAIIEAGGEPRVTLRSVCRPELSALALAVTVSPGSGWPACAGNVPLPAPYPPPHPPLTLEQHENGELRLLLPLPNRSVVQLHAQALEIASVAGNAATAVEDEAELFALLSVADERDTQIRRLNEELEETNRGVLALYVELEQRDEQIRQAHRGVFREFEDALRPLPLQVGGVELAVHYRPAQENSPTGGDLYDWLMLPSGELHITVVDVMGHGVTSTRDALNVTHVVRTLSLEGHPLSGLIQRANALLEAHAPDLIATLLVARFDPRSGALRVAGGGHPPLLVVDPGRKPRYLEAPGRAIGYPEAGPDTVAETVISPGGFALLYTDGLIENTRDIIKGMKRLAEVVAKNSALPTGELPAMVVRDVLADGSHTDDTLALALRWIPPAS